MSLLHFLHSLFFIKEINICPNNYIHKDLNASIYEFIVVGRFGVWLLMILSLTIMIVFGFSFCFLRCGWIIYIHVWFIVSLLLEYRNSYWSSFEVEIFLFCLYYILSFMLCLIIIVTHYYHSFTLVFLCHL